MADQQTEAVSEMYAFDIESLRKTGMLWLINRVIFHPRGMRFQVHVDDEKGTIGWSISKGRECVVFDEEADDLGFERSEALFKRLDDLLGDESKPPSTITVFDRSD